VTTTPPAPQTGMPTWLKVIIVIVIVIALGCCGIFSTCLYLGHKAASSAADRIQEMQKEGEKRRAEIQKRLEEEGKRIDLPAPSDNSPSARETPGTPTTPNAPTPSPDSAIKATRLPANFPSDVPTYSGFVPTFALSDKNAGSGSVIFTGKGSTETVSDWYEKQLQQNGWKQESSTSVNEAYIQSYSKDNRTLSVSITPETDGKTTLISIGYGKK